MSPVVKKRLDQGIKETPPNRRSTIDGTTTSNGSKADCSGTAEDDLQTGSPRSAVGDEAVTSQVRQKWEMGNESFDVKPAREFGKHKHCAGDGSTVNGFETAQQCSSSE